LKGSIFTDLPLGKTCPLCFYIGRNHDIAMHSDRVTCPVCGRSVERTSLLRHQGSKICLAKSQVEKATVDLRKPVESEKHPDQKPKAQKGDFKCPHCGYDYGPFARPFFEKTDKEFLELDCAACFQRFCLQRGN